MKKQFAYFYFMKNEQERIRTTIPHHVTYWQEKKLPGYAGGPFADRSGGLITFEAETNTEASEIVENDPFVSEGLLESKWLKEWMLE
jgi:uncharacterized protein YciI